jgi:X-X-X-Leu-X-X-Gly heptad repeat protein
VNEIGDEVNEIGDGVNEIGDGVNEIGDGVNRIDDGGMIVSVCNEKGGAGDTRESVDEAEAEAGNIHERETESGDDP